MISACARPQKVVKFYVHYEIADQIKERRESAMPPRFNNEEGAKKRGSHARFIPVGRDCLGAESRESCEK